MGEVKTNRDKLHMSDELLFRKKLQFVQFNQGYSEESGQIYAFSLRFRMEYF